tara:strand:- start:238 stop:612 length:375 start_codon:yes stop_codon:yes gene_type:complete
MKTKEQQIEELKATAVKLKQQIEALEKPKQWEPRGKADKGLYQESIDAMRTYNPLLAYVYEFGGNWVADWEDADQAKYCLFYDYSMWEWDIETTYEYCVSGTVYMSPNCALELADKLNSGEVVL